MNKQQLFWVSGGILLLFGLYFFGNNIPPQAPPTPPTAQAGGDHAGHNHEDHPPLEFDSLLAKAKQRLTPNQLERVLQLENAVVRGDVKAQQIKVYQQLASFWRDSIRLFEPYAHYLAEAAKLENSEKSLTFAARLFLENLIPEQDHLLAEWMAGHAKVLFEKALVLNPSNDSAKIGLGACYIFGNLSSNPMEGILPLREIADKQPSNAYANMMLGLGGKRSGQWDKAAERFEKVLAAEPRNIEAMFHAAECYEAMGDKKSAIKWYQTAKKQIQVPQVLDELNKRIQELSK